MSSADLFGPSDFHSCSHDHGYEPGVSENGPSDTSMDPANSAFSDKLKESEQRFTQLFGKVDELGGKFILDFDNTIDIDSDYTLGETAVGWLNDMATSGVDAYLVTGNGNQERITDAIVSAVEPENREYWENLLSEKAYYGAGDKSDEYDEIIGDSDPSKWMLVDDNKDNVKDFMDATDDQGFAYRPRQGYATYDEFQGQTAQFVEHLGGDSGNGSTAKVDSWYERHNDEALGRRDNEMSKREVKSFRDDDSLSSEDKAIAEAVYERRKEFDADGNGRLSRTEFQNAVSTVSGDSISPTDPTDDPQQAHTLYETYNDEATGRRDNEMSKREVKAFSEDSALAPELQEAAEYIYENRKLFDVNRNGRLSREEFLTAFSEAMALKGNPSNNNRPDGGSTSRPDAGTRPDNGSNNRPDDDNSQPSDPPSSGGRVDVSSAVRRSAGSGSQGTRELSLGGGNNPHKDVSSASGHQVLVVIDDAMEKEHIDNALTALEAFTDKAPGLGFVVKLESELSSEDKRNGGLFLEAVRSRDIDGYKGYASLGGREGRFAHIRVATDTSEDEFVETWSHEIGHGLGLEHNLGTGESPLAHLSVMSDNDRDKSKDAPLPTSLDVAALKEFGYNIQAQSSKVSELNRLRR